MNKCIHILLILFLASPVAGQLSLVYYDTIPVSLDGASLIKNPWAGGLNSPQFSPIDLNGDGVKDLFVFERGYNGKVLTFINKGTPNEVDYFHAPEYESLFPTIENWALLVDYNCDGREDIFNWISGGMTVYRNDYDSMNGLSFTLVSASSNPWSPAVTTEGSITSFNLFLSPFDIPAITDIDNDGDVDLLTFCLNCSMVEYNKNYSIENYGTCDSLDFKIEESCWGYFSENLLTNSIDLGVSCKTGTGIPNKPNAHPGGSSMLALDMDGDTDKELVLGNINSYELIMLLNGGDSVNATMISVIPDFPSNSTKVYIPVFPAPFHLDVNNDGIRDLVAAPNTTSGVRNFTSVWYYRNDGADNVPLFNYQQNDFLQGEMIEVGEGAYPVFFDHNGDGLMDMVIGNYGYWGSGGNYDGKLSLYLNTGTLAEPSFQLDTRDYQNISTYGLNGVYPAFGDLDGDGDLDMILGDYDGLLHYFENTAGVGAPAVFILSQANYMGIDVGQFAAPQLVDANRDGHLDLIIGERGGRIKYFHNKATGPVASFSSASTSDYLGGIDVMPDCCTGYNVPFMTTIDSTGDYFLFVGSEKGVVQLYGNIENNLTGNFTPIDTAISELDFGERSSISGADINNDGTLELIVGNYRGGVSILSLTGSAVIGIESQHTQIAGTQIYPNPTSGKLNFKVSGYPLTSVEQVWVYDRLGRMVIEKCGSDIKSMDISSISSGIYFVKIMLSNELVESLKVVRP